MIYLYSDVLGRSGGVESYLHALAVCLKDQGIPVVIAVSEQEPCPLLDELSQWGIEIYRQPMVLGDRWHLRKRLLIRWLKKRLQPADWVYCVRQPMPELYLETVRAIHARGARIAASWMLAPEFLRPPKHLANSCNQAVEETDAVISVSHSTVHQFKQVYGYEGQVHVVPLHNLKFFGAPVPVPPAPPYRIGYMGRVEIAQKNLDTILLAFSLLVARRNDVELHIHGGGPDEGRFNSMVQEMNLARQVFVNGPYDHRRDLGKIIAGCHLFVHTSRYEGGPCFSLLELLQAGRYVVSSPVGGVPDIYGGRPDLGRMVRPDDPQAIVAALEEALGRIALNAVDQGAMRAHYDKHFNMAAAHRAWTRALAIAPNDAPEDVAAGLPTAPEPTPSCGHA